MLNKGEGEGSEVKEGKRGEGREADERDGK